jgi:hypothetical protein
MDQCEICGTAFKRHYRRGGKRQIFCSKACTYQARYVERVCLTCGKHFRRNTLARSHSTAYCSRACIERSPCQVCGEIITGRRVFQSGERRFCSRRCSSLANHVLSGEKNYVVKGFASCIRRNGKLSCERCGFDDARGLVVHHRDRDRANTAEENLETLCCNCHAIEHWPDSASKIMKLDVAKRLAEFMASPQSSSSRGSPAGMKQQRHPGC